jgi:hypothetical protein
MSEMTRRAGCGSVTIRPASSVTLMAPCCGARSRAHAHSRTISNSRSAAPRGMRCPQRMKMPVSHGEERARTGKRMPANSSRILPCEGSCYRARTEWSPGSRRSRPPSQAACGPVVTRTIHTGRNIDRASHSGGAAPALHRTSDRPRSCYVCCNVCSPRAACNC